jgi:hypothetical protein
MIKLKDILFENKIVEEKKPIKEFVIASLAIGALFKLLMKWYKKNEKKGEELEDFINFENIEKYLDKND